MAETITTKTDELELDAILSARFGAAAGRDLVAETLNLNPGLAALGANLPAGTTIILPAAPTHQQRTAARKVVSLFG